MSGFNVIERDNLLKQVGDQQRRIERLEALLQGAGIDDVRIASLSANKLTAGIISVLIGIGASEKIEIDGANNRILIYDDNDDPRILIGYDEDGF
jgi:hypothetical protein